MTPLWGDCRALGGDDWDRMIAGLAAVAAGAGVTGPRPAGGDVYAD